MLPEMSDREHVYEHHMVLARGEVDNFGLADPSTFAAKLQKAS